MTKDAVALDWLSQILSCSEEFKQALLASNDTAKVMWIEDQTMEKAPRNPKKISFKNSGTYDMLVNMRNSENLGVFVDGSYKFPAYGFYYNKGYQEERDLCLGSPLGMLLPNHSQYVERARMNNEENGFSYDVIVYNDMPFLTRKADPTADMFKAFVVNASVPDMRLSTKLDGNVAWEERYAATVFAVMEAMYQNGVKNVLLTDAGCDERGNNVTNAAICWKEYISKYGGNFDSIVFAIRDKDNLNEFKRVFKDASL